MTSAVEIMVEEFGVHSVLCWRWTSMRGLGLKSVVVCRDRGGA